VSVRTAFDPAKDLGRYRTFAMLEPNRPISSKNTEVDPFVLLRLRQLTYLGLRQRGLSSAPRDAAELLVIVTASRDAEIYVYRSGPYYQDPIYGPMWSNQVVRVDEGIVVIDLIDRESKSVVWRGTGVRETGRDFSEEELQDLVTSILAQYPPGSAEAK
jgi:hypothetical protein